MNFCSNSRIFSFQFHVTARERESPADPAEPAPALGEGDALTYWAIERPHLHTFLAYAQARFDKVLVYSAGVSGYVSALVAHFARKGN